MEEESDKSKMGGEIDEKMVEEWFKKKCTEEWSKEDKCKTFGKNKMSKTGATGAGVYFLGFIGAAVYFIGAATSFWVGVLGVLKAFVWPAFLIHGLLKFLGL